VLITLRLFIRIFAVECADVKFIKKISFFAKRTKENFHLLSVVLLNSHAFWMKPVLALVTLYVKHVWVKRLLANTIASPFLELRHEYPLNFKK